MFKFPLRKREDAELLSGLDLLLVQGNPSVIQRDQHDKRSVFRQLADAVPIIRLILELLRSMLASVISKGKPAPLLYPSSYKSAVVTPPCNNRFGYLGVTLTRETEQSLHVLRDISLRNSPVFLDDGKCLPSTVLSPSDVARFSAILLKEAFYIVFCSDFSASLRYRMFINAICFRSLASIRGAWNIAQLLVGLGVRNALITYEGITTDRLLLKFLLESGIEVSLVSTQALEDQIYSRDFLRNPYFGYVHKHFMFYSNSYSNPSYKSYKSYRSLAKEFPLPVSSSLGESSESRVVVIAQGLDGDFPFFQEFFQKFELPVEVVIVVHPSVSEGELKKSDRISYVRGLSSVHINNDDVLIFGGSSLFFNFISAKFPGKIILVASMRKNPFAAVGGIVSVAADLAQLKCFLHDLFFDDSV